MRRQRAPWLVALLVLVLTGLAYYAWQVLDGPELPDVFSARVEGLWPNEYEWMHAAAVIRDALDEPVEILGEPAKPSDETVQSDPQR